MSVTVRVETMAARDIGAVRSIDDIAFATAWSAATWRREVGAADRFHLVALDGEEVVGHAGLLFVFEEAHITTVAVAKGREGRGIATTLVVELLEQVCRHGSVRATLEVRAADRRTQQLYARFGFAPAGVRRGYYDKPTDDAIVMWLDEPTGEATTVRLAALRGAVR